RDQTEQRRQEASTYEEQDYGEQGQKKGPSTCLNSYRREEKHQQRQDNCKDSAPEKVGHHSHRGQAAVETLTSISDCRDYDPAGCDASLLGSRNIRVPPREVQQRCQPPSLRPIPPLPIAASFALRST